MKINKLSHQEARILEYLQKNHTITSAKAEDVSGSVNYKQSANLLIKMEKNKILKKVERGVYSLGIKHNGTQKEIKFKIKTEQPVKEEKFTFKVDNTWKPYKITLTEQFTKDLIEAIKVLEKGQSIQIPITVIKNNLMITDIVSMASAIRTRIKKYISPSYVGRYRVFNEKDTEGSTFAIRVMYYYGV